MQTRSRILISFILFFLTWVIFNIPALRTAWWFLDDYIIRADYANFSGHGLVNGRPVGGLLFYSFSFERFLDENIGNILARLGQGAAHCFAALLASEILRRSTKNWFSGLAVLPFLVWPFNSEAVLWRSGMIYPFAALFSIIGIWFIQFETESKRKTIGSLALTASMLTNQAASIFGLVTWCITFAVELIHTQKTNIGQKISEGYYVLSGYFLGGIISFTIAKQINSSRSNLVVNFEEKLSFIYELNRLFYTWPEFYPPWLSILKITILTAAALTLSLLLVNHIKKGANIALGSFLLFLTVFIVPYAPLILLAESWGTWRIMYIAPLGFGSAWLVILNANQSSRIIRYASLSIMLLTLIGYFTFSWKHVSEYVKIYEEDRKILLEADTLAKEMSINRVSVDTFPQNLSVDWNPYDVHYIYADAKLSAFIKAYTAEPFIVAFSALVPTSDESIKLSCHTKCIDSFRETIAVIPLDSDGVICICP